MPRYGAQPLEVTLLGRHGCTINSFSDSPSSVACLFLGTAFAVTAGLHIVHAK